MLDLLFILRLLIRIGRGLSVLGSFLGFMLRPSSDPPLFSSRDPPPDPMTTRDLEPSRDSSRDLGGEASQPRDYDVTDDITNPDPGDVNTQDPDDIMEEPQLRLLRMISSLRSSLTDPSYS